MRLLGGVMMIGGCLGLGLWYRDQQSERIGALRALTEILELFMSQIRYGKATLPECCRVLAERVEEPYRSGLSRVWLILSEQRGASFRRVFCEEMKISMDSLPLREAERRIFLQVFSEQGFQDEKMQLRSMEQGREQLRKILGELEREQKEKGRVCVALGAMSGLLLLIVLM